MIEVFHLKASQYRVQRWKNGKGETREVAVDDRDPFRWRVSWATIASSGPFSPYPGYDRVLVLLEGGPLALTHDDRPARVIACLSPHKFKGDATTQASVSGPGEDFNVFTRTGQARAGVYPALLRQGEEMQFPVIGAEHFIFCAEGKLDIFDQNTGTQCVLERRDCFRVRRDPRKEFLNLRGKGQALLTRCLWVVIHLEN